MVSFRSVLALFAVVGVLVRGVFAIVVAVVAWVAVDDLVSSGQLPAEPLGLAASGLPATVLGIPTAYAGGIALLTLLIVFGNGSTSGDGGFADDGGFGGDGGGGGGE